MRYSAVIRCPPERRRQRVEVARRRSTLVAAAVIATLVALSAALLASAPGAQATLRGRNGNLLLQLNPAVGSEQLWLSGPQGQRPQLLTVAFCTLSGLAGFLPSGKQIVFQEMATCGQSTTQDFDVVLIDADGTRSRVLAQFSRQIIPPPKVAKDLPGSIELSPDGRVLAYGFNELLNPRTGHSTTVHKVLFINIKMGRTTRWVTLPGQLSGPTWSSSGKLVFLSTSGDGAVETTRADGSHPRRISIKFPGPASAQITATEVAPSPDGSQLAVTAATGVVQGGPCGEGDPEPPCPTYVYLVGAAGGKATRLTHSGESGAPVWSPDGHQIAFHDGALNKILTLETGHVTTLVERIPRGGLGVVDWQALP